MILAVDTSLPALSVALVDGERVVASLSLASEGSRNEKLLPAIDWLLHESSATLDDLHLVAVTRGPGSFTGVRVGLATVQGIALGREVATCALSTHHAAAHARRDRDIVVHTDGGRGEFYVSCFRRGKEMIAPTLMTAERLREAIGEYGNSFDLTGEADRFNVAVWLALAAAELEREGAAASYRELTPIYVRRAEAEVQLEKQKE